MSSINSSSSTGLTNGNSSSSTGSAGLSTIIGGDRVIIPTRWEWTYIFASFCVASLGAATALMLVRQRSTVKGRVLHHLYFYGASVVLGAIGIWCMHFVGMMAVTLRDPQDTSLTLTMRFDPVLTAFSLIAAAVGMALAFTIAGDPAKQQVWRHLVGALAGAGGVASMHYMGMAAMIFRGSIEYDPGIVVASLIIGLVTVLAAQIIIFRLHMYWTRHFPLLIGAAIVMGVAVCAVHYTGMASATYVFDEAPFTRNDLPDLHVIFITTIVLACTACGSMLCYLFYQYRHVLLFEISKADSLLLGAVIVDSRGRILLTTNNTLPSAIIDARYGGQGVFDRHNADFMRLFKVSLLWNAMPKYVKRVKELGANSSIPAYSVALIERFERAANQLATDLHVHVARLGIMYWYPTKNMMTVVIRQSNARSGLLDSSGMRWVDRAQARTFLQPYLPEGRDPDDWLDQVLDYEERFRMPMTLERDAHHLDEFLRSVAVDLLLDKETIEQDVQEWHAALGRYVKTKHHLSLLVQNADEWRCIKLDPMVKVQIHHSIGSPTADLALSTTSTSSTVYIGLYCVSANARGLHVLVPSHGPFHMVPIVPFGQSPTLTPTHLAWLDYAKQNGPHQLQHAVNNGGIDGLSPRHQQQQNAPSISPNASPKQGAANHRVTEHTTENEASADGHTGGSRNASVNGEHRLQRHTSSFGQLPSIEVLRMHSDFLAARRTLVSILGTDKDLLASRLHSSFISLATDCHVLLFCTCNLSSLFPAAYNSSTLHQLPLPMFEAMHYSQHSSKSAANWTRDILSNQLKTGNGAGAGGGGGGGGGGAAMPQNAMARNGAAFQGDQFDRDDPFFGSGDFSDSEGSVARSVSKSPMRTAANSNQVLPSANGGATAAAIVARAAAGTLSPPSLVGQQPPRLFGAGSDASDTTKRVRGHAFEAGKTVGGAGVGASATGSPSESIVADNGTLAHSNGGHGHAANGSVGNGTGIAARRHGGASGGQSLAGVRTSSVALSTTTVLVAANAGTPTSSGSSLTSSPGGMHGSIVTGTNLSPVTAASTLSAFHVNGAPSSVMPPAVNLFVNNGQQNGGGGSATRTATFNMTATAVAPVVNGASSASGNNGAAPAMSGGTASGSGGGAHESRCGSGIGRSAFGSGTINGAAFSSSSVIYTPVPTTLGGAGEGDRVASPPHNPGAIMSPTSDAYDTD